MERRTAQQVLEEELARLNEQIEGTRELLERRRLSTEETERQLANDMATATSIEEALEMLR